MDDERPTTAPTTISRDSKRVIRVLLVDDHSLFRQTLGMTLGQQPGFTVVGEAGDGRDAVSAAIRWRPDVVLMDLALPKLNGIESTKQIVKRVPWCRVVVVSAYLDDERLMSAIDAGAAGYVVKSAGVDELLLAIETVARGSQYFSAEIERELPLPELLQQAGQPRRKTAYESLSAREREVLQLIGEGLSNNRIAEELCISVKTVDAHKAHVMKKLHARNRTDLIRFAISHGLVGLERLEAAETDAALGVAKALLPEVAEAT